MDFMPPGFGPPYWTNSIPSLLSSGAWRGVAIVASRAVVLSVG